MPVPVATLSESCIWSPSMDQAAVEVLKTLPPGKQEHAGAIYVQDGPKGLLEYCYSVAVAGTDDNFAFKNELGRKLAAIWHSHPNDKLSEYFSPNDVATVAALQRPSYILDQSTNQVKRLDPGNRARPGDKFPRGKVVADLDEEVHEILALVAH